MKILNTAQIRQADQATIKYEPISSIDLMERASTAFTETFCTLFDTTQTVKVICGLGNNGGDGLCIARQLHNRGYQIEVYIIRFSPNSSDDFQVNEQRLQALEGVKIKEVFKIEDIPPFEEPTLLIDALFGSGLSRPITGLPAQIIQRMNTTCTNIVAVDLPSGLYVEKPVDEEQIVVQAAYTISFETPKLSFLLPQNAHFVGDWRVVPIGLSPSFIQSCPTPYYYLSEDIIRSILQPRGKFSHKGTNGHLLFIGGSKGKIGACILACRAGLKAGAGLVTAYVPACGYQIMQIAVPEVMCLTDQKENYIHSLPPLNNYKAIAVGPGLDTQENTSTVLLKLLKESRCPLVIDADALNIIAKNNWLQHLPKHSILTPHPKEFSRLFGSSPDDYLRLEKLEKVAQEYQVVIVLKGAHTAVALPDGTTYFNSTGNPAMATAGSGDVLTGIIGAFLARGYTSQESAFLGVYLHGLAGDRAAWEKGNILAGDIITYFRESK